VCAEGKRGLSTKGEETKIDGRGRASLANKKQGSSATGTNAKKKRGSDSAKGRIILELLILNRGGESQP